MAVFKCKMCGGTLDITAGTTVVKCDYCDTTQTVPSADDEKKIALFTRANRLRAGNEFDKASGIYESIIADFPEEAEAYWGLVLCKYGVEYVDDPATGNKISTCHRSSFESVMDDNNFELTLEYADTIAKKVYREEAKQLEEIRKGIIEVSSKEEPYDIFICYKETDENGDRTIDSVLAQDIYDMLTAKGYRTFFARITLEDKLGQEYEPYIFAALNTAKIMLAVGTSFEHYDAVWVKNEWSRFLKLMAADKSKHLIPCFKNLDAYDMPKEFARLQAQDLGKVGADQDLLRGIEKILPKQKVEVVKEAVVSINHKADSLVKRGFIYLEDNDYSKANEYFDNALDEAPDNGDAYLGKVLSLFKLSAIEDLYSVRQDLTQIKDFKRAVRFSVGENKAILDKINEQACRNSEIRKLIIGLTKVIKVKEEEEKKNIANCKEERIYQQAKNKTNIRNEALQKEAAALFESISNYKDSAGLARKCIEKAEALRKDDIYAQAKMKMQSNTIESYNNAIQQFRYIPGWKDSGEQIEICKKKIEELKADKKQSSAPNTSYQAPKTNTKKSGGCYVATCVYGSYDCPQVWTLRRFRDNTLASTWYGRAFIKTYYTVSPTLVKWFGETKWFKNMWKGKLDRMVKNLQSEGVESTPYEDRNW